jgi:hypothetical protein
MSVSLFPALAVVLSLQVGLPFWVFPGDHSVGRQQAAGTLTTEQWLEDLDFVVSQLKSHHPNLYYRTSEAQFDSIVAQSRTQIGVARSDMEAVAAIQRTISGIQDGHTQLAGTGVFEITDLRYPFRLDRFTDGVHITVVAKEYEHALGARVVAVNGHPIERALTTAEHIVSKDNEFGRTPHALRTFTFPRILYGLGLADEVRKVVLDVVLTDGVTTTLTMESITDRSSLGWANRVNIGPTDGEYVHAALVGQNAPLHLQRQGPDVAFYWFKHLTDDRAVYFQFNQVANQPGNSETLLQFSDRLWSHIDTHADSIDKFVVDLRYNDGGTGLLLFPIVNEIIKRDFINKRGSLFALVGRRTFSAAVIFLEELVAHTDVTVLGEPPACPFNLFSNSVFRGNLPNSGFQVMVASRQIDNAFWPDTVYFSPHIPAPFSGRDYFGGRDPALDIALRGDVRSIADLASDEGAEVAAAEFNRQRREYADFWWWRGWNAAEVEQRIDDRGHVLMGDGRLARAFEVFKLNTVLFPESWSTWDSLGELHYNMGEYDLSLESYRKSVTLNPDNENARQWIDRITHR